MWLGMYQTPDLSISALRIDVRTVCLRIRIPGWPNVFVLVIKTNKCICFEKNNLMEKGGGCLRPLAADATGKLHVLAHDGYTLGVDGAEVSVLEQADQVSLRSLLQGGNGRRLEAEICLEVLGNLADKALEGELADQQISAFLVAANLTEGHGSGAKTMRLLNVANRTSFLGRLLKGKMFAWDFASGTLSGGLLGASHFVRLKNET
jgi:hypothetical protein